MAGVDTEKLTRVIAVVGPTASGKTALSIELAKRHDGEIISCDSMQIYKYMDIGTAKPDTGEMCGIPHHMISIAEPSVKYSCADYAAEATALARDIASRGRLPIFCGGTGLYLDSVLSATDFPEIKAVPELREKLSQLSPQELHDRLEAVDAPSAAAIHPNNVKRVIRALEIYNGTGIPKSEWDRRSRRRGSEFESVFIGIDYADRNELYERINRRVDLMLAAGLLDEVRAVAPLLSPTAAQAIGYRQLLEYISGGCTLDEAVLKIKLASRNYAKRQLTWFRRNPDIRWITVGTGDTFKDIVNSAEKLLT